MSNTLGMTAAFAGNVARFAWYTGLSLAADWVSSRHGNVPVERRPGRVVPDRQAQIADMLDLFRRDAELVRDYAAAAGIALGFTDHLARVRALFDDIPDAVQRRMGRNASTARTQPGVEGLPGYFLQDFHFQSGGYLTEQSARLYDVQVETLFNGAAHAMRRQALGPIAEAMRGRDQRRTNLLDVACGTGRFLREVRMVYPAMKLAGLDLSKAYLGEAKTHFSGLRPAEWLDANAEEIPLPDASQDIVTSIYLYHELPPEVRRTVTREIARVLKPGGMFVFIDSLQRGDRPGWDGLLEGFPERFHEPFYRHYTIDDLDGDFAAAGLAARSWWPAFLSKVMVRVKV